MTAGCERPELRPNELHTSFKTSEDYVQEIPSPLYLTTETVLTEYISRLNSVLTQYSLPTDTQHATRKGWPPLVLGVYNLRL